MSTLSLFTIFLSAFAGTLLGGLFVWAFTKRAGRKRARIWPPDGYNP